MGMDGEQPTITVDCSLGIHHPKRRQTKTPALNLPPEIIQLESRYSVIESSAFSVKTDGLPAVPDNLMIILLNY